MNQFLTDKHNFVFGYKHLIPKTPEQWLEFHKYPRYRRKRFSFFCSLLVLTHPAVIKPVIKMEIPKGFFYEELFRSWQGDGLVVSQGKKWRKHRKMLEPIMHGNILKEYSGIINSCVDIFIRKINKLNGKEGCVDAINRFISDVAMKCFFTRDDDLQQDGSFELCKTFQSQFQALYQKKEKPYLYSNFIFNLTSLGRKARHDMNILHKYADGLIDQRIQENVIFDKNNVTRGDVLDVLIHGSGQDGKRLTRKEIRDEV